jgi:hypothetical protein
VVKPVCGQVANAAWKTDRDGSDFTRALSKDGGQIARKIGRITDPFSRPTLFHLPPRLYAAGLLHG